MTPLRVAIDANALAWGWGGIPRYIHRLATELGRRDDIELTMLANTSAPFARVPGTREVVARRRAGPLWRNAFVTDWLARERPDVYWAAETLVPLRVPVPLVMTVHDLAVLRFPGLKSRGQVLSYRTTVTRGARRAAAVIAVSEATAREVRERLRVPGGRIHVIGLAADERFAPGDREAARALVRERFGADGPFVLAAGAIEPRKGLDVLVDAARLAAGRGLPWRVVLAGSPGFRGDDLAAAARDAGALVLGGVDEEELLELYRAADVVTVPSRWEGFGLPVLEAMACGTPVCVAAGAGALEEVAGGAAVVVGERSGDAWVAAIESARARRDQLAEAGIARAAGYRWADQAAATYAVLARAAGRS